MTVGGHNLKIDPHSSRRQVTSSDGIDNVR